MRVVLCHGFNVRDGGAGSVDRLIPLIKKAGYEVDKDEGDYGYFNLFMIRMFASRKRTLVLRRLARAFRTADVIITHSNGANFTTKALNTLSSKYDNTKLVVHISPALNCKTPIPEAVKAQLVLCTPHDGWVKLSSYLPLHSWGRMGARGYQGPSMKNTNVEEARVKKHSGWFNLRFYRKTWKYAESFIEEHNS